MHALAPRIYILQRISGSAEKKMKTFTELRTLSDFYDTFNKTSKYWESFDLITMGLIKQKYKYNFK